MDYSNQYCDRTQYLCDICDQVFFEIVNFTIHHIHEHGHQKDQISYDCANCYQSFTDQFHFEKHVVSSSFQLDEIFSKENTSNSHTSAIDDIHEGVKYYCESCGKMFERQDRLNEHIYLDHESPLNHQIVIDHLRKTYFSLERELNRKKDEKEIQIKRLEVATTVRANQIAENENDIFTEIPKQQLNHEKFEEYLNAESYFSLERELNMKKDEKEIHIKKLEVATERENPPAENEKDIFTENPKDVLNEHVNHKTFEEYSENVKNLDTGGDLSSESDTDYDSFIKTNAEINQPIANETDGVAQMEANTICILEKYKEPYSVLKNTKLNASGKTIEKVENHQCELCGRYFSEKRNLQFHIATVHEGEKSSNNQNDSDRNITTDYLDPEDYKCDICGKLFTFKRNLESHMSFHNFCGTLFPDELKLEEHILAAHEDKKCDTCGITFFHQKYLDDHMKIHTSSTRHRSKSYKCKICEKIFSRVHMVRKHLYEAHQVNKYMKCDTCDKLFFRKERLKKHQKICVTKNEESSHKSWLKT